MSKLFLALACLGLVSCTVAEKQEAKSLVNWVLNETEAACVDGAIAQGIGPSYATEVSFVCRVAEELIPVVQSRMLSAKAADAGVAALPVVKAPVVKVGVDL